MVFFERLKLYSVHTKTDDDGEVTDIVFVPEGFNFWAFFFNMFWALLHRCWLLALLCFGIFIVTEALATRDWLSTFSVGVIQIGAFVIVGLMANDEWRRSLTKRGYTADGTAGGTSKIHAQLRYFDRVDRAASPYYS